MPTLDWIGKQAVVNHHRQVPFHLLETDPNLSTGDPSAGNLLVQGDNLVALKALLPYYAGKVKCIYIDPPYNTGNEDWVYNDNVNSPEMRAWLGKAVGREAEDLSRHDKWLCMMYPRMALLREFLTDDGSIFVSIDDNEVQNLRGLMDEIFGQTNFVATFVWEKRTTRENRRVFSFNHDFIVCFAKRKALFEQTRGELPLTDEVKGRYANPDGDARGDWQSVSLNAQAGHGTPTQFYEITTPSGRRLMPPKGRCWTVTARRLEELIADRRVYFGPTGNNAPRLKKFLSESERGLTPHTLWKADEVGTTDSAAKDLMLVLDEEVSFETPKPVDLVRRIVAIGCDKTSIFMDAFVGSGTTGHAVLAQNAADGGTRRFLAIEMDPDIGRDVTAQRLARVIGGYTPRGKTDPVPGLGGGFRYCTLGESLFDETGAIRSTVRFPALAAHVFFAETGSPLLAPVDGTSPLLGAHEGRAVYLLYNGVLGDRRPESGNVLTADVLRALPPHDGQKVVFGEGCTVPRERLVRAGFEFRQVPYELRVG